MEDQFLIYNPKSFDDYHTLWMVSDEVLKYHQETKNPITPNLPPQQTRMGLGIPVSWKHTFNMDDYLGDVWKKNRFHSKEYELYINGVYGFVTCNVSNNKIYLDVINVNPKFKRTGVGSKLMEQLLECFEGHKLIVSPIESDEGKKFFKNYRHSEPIPFEHNSYQKWCDMLEQKIWKPKHDKLWEGKEPKWETTEELEDGNVKVTSYEYGIKTGSKKIDKDGKEFGETWNVKFYSKYHTQNGRMFR